MILPNSKWLISVIAITLFFILLAWIGLSFTSDDTVRCQIQRFNDFAYLPDTASYPITKVLPDSPWQLETTLPGQEEKTYHFNDVQIKLSHTKNEEQEIWLFKYPDFVSGTLTRAGSFLIYRPDSQTWKEVSAKIGDSNLIVRDLFLTSDGTIWAGIGNFQDPPYLLKAPVLSKFNESTQRFEAAIGGLEMSTPQEQRRLIEVPHIVLDKQDIFWIFAPGDGIYRYDPKTQITDKQTNLPDMGWLDTALSVDGSIYFQDVYAYETKDFLFQFFPDTLEIIPIEIPNQTWIYSNGLLVDRRGRLWLGATGYLDTNGKWRLIHPHPQKNFQHYGSPVWAPPTLIFESSNGLLWYAEDHDMERLGEGTAWYDPETGEGCLFTNLASYIVEDAEKQLWMVADGKLYRYPLDH